MSPCYGSPQFSKVASGTGIKVYRCLRFTPNGRNHSSPWASKVLNSRLGRESVLIQQRLFKEAEILRQMDHPNIIKLKIVNGIEERSTALNLEFGGKSLSEILYGTRKSSFNDSVSLTAENCQIIITDVINALKYLHLEKFLLHGDIKSDNILFDQQKNVAKVCDFGVSLEMRAGGSGEFLVRKNHSECYFGSPEYQPKEVMVEVDCEEDRSITDRCDIWAFGLVIFEIIVRKPPYSRLIPSPDGKSGFEIAVDPAIDELLGTKPILSDQTFYAPEKVVKLFNWCTEEDFRDRASILNVHHLWNE
ncbi:lymphokine-activated killer T-cell-originated protein kinase-like [Symsagittifera roscoffensis]|uniref:lymphokine-activated killer T-cell-originated protein kinase-like n=1 Tax=Symsagittifera roscoffensis TaxID=84072 RepID=UPI00307B77E8